MVGRRVFAGLPDGRKLIILNPTHGENRQNATLMEEICHVFLGHKPSRLAIENVNKYGQPIARDYRGDEEEAYSIGAAALVPFSALRRMCQTGKNFTRDCASFQRQPRAGRISNESFPPLGRL